MPSNILVTLNASHKLRLTDVFHDKYRRPSLYYKAKSSHEDQKFAWYRQRGHMHAACPFHRFMFSVLKGSLSKGVWKTRQALAMGHVHPRCLIHSGSYGQSWYHHEKKSS